MMRFISTALAALLVMTPCGVMADPDPKLHASTATSSTSPDRIVWMRADAWQRAQKDAIQERERRINSQSQTGRCLAGLDACRRGRTRDSSTIATETTLRVKCETAREKANQATVWQDAVPWLVAISIAGAFAGGIALGLEAANGP